MIFKFVAIGFPDTLHLFDMTKFEDCLITIFNFRGYCVYCGKLESYDMIQVYRNMTNHIELTDFDTSLFLLFH